MKKTLKLEGLDCANCAAKIERNVANIDGVNTVCVNFMTSKMIIDGDESRMETIISETKKIIHKYEPEVFIK